jgi:DNA replicative helicase MCM subunit Mcm2 (Cdc46/Mcm family)
MLIGLLRWLDNNMEKLLIDKVATQDFELARMGIQIIVNPRQNLKITPSPITPEIPPTAIVEVPKIVEEVKKVPETSFATVTEHKGTQIKLEGLKIEQIGILECTLLKFVILCQRCRTQIEVNLSSGQTYAVECTKCHNAHVVTYRKDQMHEASEVLGFLDISNAIPFDVLSGSQFTASCLECSSNVLFKQIPITGMEYSQNCTNCHKKLAVTIERWEIFF